MDFCCKGWKGSTLEIFDSETRALLYTVRSKLRKPHLIIQSGRDGPELGTAVYHTLSSKIDLEIDGQPTEMKTKRMLSSTYTFSSRAFGGATMTWESKSHWRTFDYTLLDDKALPIAKCSAPYWSSNFAGKIEILNADSVDERQRREILITGFALTYLMIITYYAAIAS